MSKQEANEAADKVIREGLKNLAAWCENRAEGDTFNTLTTLCMLRRKIDKLQDSSVKAWRNNI